jgi:hypothetical protein
MDSLALAAASSANAVSIVPFSTARVRYDVGAGMHVYLKRYGCVPPAVCAGSKNCSAVAPGEVSHLQQPTVHCLCSASTLVRHVKC